MKLQKLAGATSEIWQVFIRDSSSTTGAGLAALVFNSASLTAYYHRDTDTTATAITLVTMTVGTFTSSGFKEIDATNMPGWYQFCPPNAAIASGAKSCAFHLKGATNMAPLPIEVQLTATNVDSATAFMTSVATVTTVTNQLTAAQIATGVWQDATPGDFTTGASIGKSVMNGVALGTGLTINGYTGNTVQTGDSFARIGAVGAGLTGITGATLAATTGLGNQTANITGNLSGSVGSLTTNNDKTGYALSATGSAAMTEGYRADGATGTLAELLYEIIAHLGESSIAATTKTIKKIDGATTAATFTLDSAITPTSITRAT